MERKSPRQIFRSRHSRPPSNHRHWSWREPERTTPTTRLAALGAATSRQAGIAGLAATVAPVLKMLVRVLAAGAYMLAATAVARNSK